MSAAAISALERGSRRAPYRSSVDLLADGLGIGKDARAHLHAVAERRRRARALPVKLRRNNLPFQISSFVGRENELGDLQALLAKSRLLTIVGPGGVGKTRLTLELAHVLLSQYADGAWFVDLAGLRNADFVAQTVATQLDLHERPNEPIEKTLTAELSAKNLLLVIDNAEHLLGGVAKLAKAILLRCPRVALAITSREPLHIPGEQIYRLCALSEAPGGADVAMLSQHDSTRLFLERARDANPSMMFDESEGADVVSLCKRLEGMPLAIELACARLSSLTLNQLASRLKSSLTLASKDLTEISRHRTIRDTIAWSYDLLSPSEQSALLALSTFQGGCASDAIRAVAVEVEDVDEAIDSLVDKSLLQVDDSATEERWRLLDAVREYANEKLKAAGGLEAASSRHAAHYAGVAAAARADDTPTAYAQLDGHTPNIRCALEWIIARDVPAAKTLILDLAPYWRARGALTEASTWIGKVLERELIDEGARAQLLCLAASFETLRDDLRKSLALSHEALRLYRLSGNSSGAAEALFRIAEAAHRQGHLDGAEAGYKNALRDFRASANGRGEMLCIGNLGILARQRGDLQHASTLLDDAIGRAVALGDRRVAGEFTIAMGWVQLGLEEVDQSRRLFEHAFQENLRAQNPVVTCFARHGLATIALKEGRLDDASSEFLATLHAARELQLTHYIARALHGIAAIQAVNGDVETAARSLGLADRLFERSGRRLRDSIAYDIAARAIAMRVPEPRRAALLREGAAMQLSEALAAFESDNAEAPGSA